MSLDLKQPEIRLQLLRNFRTKMWQIINLWMPILGIICLILHTAAVESAILDSRCYLEGGGSAESFLASEDLDVGAIIGKLRINGDPDIENGNINLLLREKNAPVEIVPGTKNLALAVELDKEGQRGPSSVYVNVICIRRHSKDPSFVIPVNVRVIDVNDNAPQWKGTPYALTLSEVTVPGTRILQTAHAEDADQPGPFSTVEYQVLPGPYAEYVQFLNPLDGTLVLRKALDYETLQNFTIKLRAQDQGTPPKYSDTQLRVIITDADDQNPKFMRESYTGELPADGRPGEVKIRPEPIKAVDQDIGICSPIQYSIVQSQDTKYFRIHPHNGAITLLTPIGYGDLVNGATLVVKATQIDNPDRYALATVMLSRPGATHGDLTTTTLSFVQKKFFMRIREDAGVGNRILALPTNKPGKALTYIIPDPVNSQYFSVGNLGEVILMKPLDYEKMTRHDFPVIATDGITNTTAEVTLEVIDVNDWEPRFRETHYEFVVPKHSLNRQSDSFEGIMLGKLEAADGDRNDKLEFSLRGQHAGLFEIDSEGRLYIRPEQMQSVNESSVHLIAIATDSGTPPRSTSVPITVTMEGMALAQTSWSTNLLGMFAVVIGLFCVIIVFLCCYIVRSKKRAKRQKNPPRGRNRVHSSANLVTHEKLPGNSNGNGSANGNGTAGITSSGGVSVLHMKHGGNITMSNPISHALQQHHHQAHSPVHNLERDRERQRERESYAATVRSIVSRASANGQLYEETPEEADEIEHDSLSPPGNGLHSNNDNNNRKQAWPTPTSVTITNGGAGTGPGTTATGRPSSGGSGPVSIGPGGQQQTVTTIANSMASNLTDAIGSSENNLTVYF